MIVARRFWISMLSMFFGEWVSTLFGAGTKLRGELLFERFEPTDEHVIADLSNHRLFSARSYVEVGPPFCEGAVADSNRRQTKGCDIVVHRHRRDKNVVREVVIDIGER